MTDDLVTRLRFRSTPTSVDDRAICYEAADEIARLRAALAREREVTATLKGYAERAESERDKRALALATVMAERDALHEGLRVLLRHIEEQGYPRVAEDMAPINMARAALREKP